MKSSNKTETTAVPAFNILHLDVVDRTTRKPPR